MLKLVAIAALIALVGCDKGSESTNASATAEMKLSPDETAMLASLPAGNVALLGGNLVQFQKSLNHSALSRLVSATTQASVTAMTEWTNCFVEPKNVQMLAAVKLDAATTLTCALS